MINAADSLLFENPFETFEPSPRSESRDFGTHVTAASPAKTPAKPKVIERPKPIIDDGKVCAAAKPDQIFTDTGIMSSPIKPLGSDELHARILLKLDLQDRSKDHAVGLSKPQDLRPKPVHDLYKRSPLDLEIESLVSLFLKDLNELIKERCANKSSIFGQAAIFTLGCATIINGGKLTLLFGISGKLTDQSKKAIDKRNALLDAVRETLNLPKTQDAIRLLFPITAEYNNLEIGFVVSTSEIFSLLVGEKAPDYGMSNPSYCFEKFVLKFVIGLINNKSIAPEDYRGLTAIGVLIEESTAPDKSNVEVKLSDKTIHYLKAYLQLIDQCDNCKHPASLELLLGMLLNKMLLSPYARRVFTQALSNKGLTPEKFDKEPPKSRNNVLKGLQRELLKKTHEKDEEPKTKPTIMSPEINSGAELQRPTPSPRLTPEKLKIGSPLSIDRARILESPGLSPITEKGLLQENSAVSGGAKESVFVDDEIAEADGSKKFTQGASALVDETVALSPKAGSMGRFFAEVSMFDQQVAGKAARLISSADSVKPDQEEAAAIGKTELPKLTPGVAV